MTLPTRSGHGDTMKRKLTAAQKRTLARRGQIAVSITLDGIRYSKTVRRRNVRNGCWEYYRRSDNDYAPSLRDYRRDLLEAQHGRQGLQAQRARA